MENCGKKFFALLLSLFFICNANCAIQKVDRHWKILAHPELVVPGEETVILLTKNAKKSEKATTSEENENVPLVENNEENLETSNFSMFDPIEASELIATLTLFDANKREIFGKIWRVDANQGLIQSHSRAKISIFPVPFRVPGHFGDGSGFVEGDTGLVQVRDDNLCPGIPVSVNSQPDWKCAESCVQSGSCIEINFRLGSRLRQIVIFTSKTKYQTNEQVEIFYQPIDEMTMAKKWPLITVWIEDATASILHEWRRGQHNEDDAKEWQFFRKITYPLGEKASLGQWRVCATTNPWIEKYSKKMLTSSSADGSVTNCVQFDVEQYKEPEPSFVLSWQPGEVVDNLSLTLDTGLISEQHFVTLMFGPEMKKSFPRHVPISGRLMSSSSEKEIEVSVQLIDLNNNKQNVSRIGPPQILDEQILLLNDEAVFEFSPIGAKTNSTNILIEARLLSVSEEWELPTNEEPENLEITEDEIESQDAGQPFETRRIETFRNRVKQSNYLLASKIVSLEDSIQDICPVWTRGLQRSFKSGDRATVSVISSCSCKDLGPIHWIVTGRNQFISWGTEDESKKISSDIHETDGARCQYNFNLDINSRMFPSSTFKVWSPTARGSIQLSGIPSGSEVIREKLKAQNVGEENQTEKANEQKDREEMAFGLQEMTVSFHDRAMAILELNVTELSHSQDHVGAEVFVEPYSFICLLGTKFEKSSTQTEKVAESDQVTEDEERPKTLPEEMRVKIEEQRSNQDAEAANQGNEAEKRPEALRPFRVGPTNWFFQCGNASEDGFYSAAFRAPASGGQWNVEAISVSPLHGLRVSKTRSVRRTQPLDLILQGIPQSVKRKETIRDVTVAIRNNMPVPMQVTIIVTGSSEDMVFLSSGRHYDSSLLNVSAYQIAGANFTINAGHLTGIKNITAHVTGVVELEKKRFVEMESLHLTRTLNVLPRGQIKGEFLTDYFCANENVGLTYDISHPEWRFHILDTNSEGVTFGLKSQTEIVLSLQGKAFEKLEIFYQLVIGADDNTVSWISLVKKAGKEQRLQTISTPDILSADEFKHFWITWKPEDGLLKVGSGTYVTEDPILTWPLGQSFKPSRIGVKNIFPGSVPNIRFWSLYNDEGSTDVNGRAGGYNKIFNLNFPSTALNETIRASIILSSDFLLPMHGALFSQESESVQPKSFNSVVQLLRDAATLLISENLGGDYTKTLTKSERKWVSDRLHQAMQNLFYFRNVDGSFGEPLAAESFSMALEHFFLLNEVESFFHVSPQLMSSLQRWILSKSEETFNQNKNSDIPSDEIEARALDILEWAPMESMIFEKYAARAYQVVERSLKSRLNDGIGILRLTRHVSSIVRASGLAAGDYLSPTPANAAFAVNANVTDRLRDEDTFVSGILSDMSTRLQDVLNCELIVKEDKLNAHGKRPEYDHDLRDLVYALSAFAHASSLGGGNEHLQFGGKEDRLNDIFNCVHTHANKLLRTSQIGYAVVRSLSDYRLGTRHQMNLPGDRDLKVSIGSGDALGPAKTWHVVTSQKEGSDFHEEIRLNCSEMIDKVYFLATGNGCSTFEISTEYETMSSTEQSNYDIAMDISEDLDQDNLLFITLCVKLSNTSKLETNIPTSISIEMFSGFLFESLTGLNLMSLNQNDVIPGGWKYVEKNQFLTIYLRELSYTCGSCFTAKFRRNFFVENLSPIRIVVQPTLKSPNDDSASIYYHSAQSSSQLRSGISSSDWLDWIGDQHTDSNGGVISSTPIPHICPCSLQCDSTTTTTTTTSITSTKTVTTTSSTTTTTTTTTTIRMQPPPKVSVSNLGRLFTATARATTATSQKVDSQFQSSLEPVTESLQTSQNTTKFQTPLMQKMTSQEPGNLTTLERFSLVAKTTDVVLTESQLKGFVTTQTVTSEPTTIKGSVENTSADNLTYVSSESSTEMTANIATFTVSENKTEAAP